MAAEYQTEYVVGKPCLMMLVPPRCFCCARFSCPFTRLWSDTVYIYIYILCILRSMEVFFWPFGSFLFRPRAFPRALGSVARREPATISRARLSPGRGPWHVLGEVKAASPIGEGFRGRRAIQVHSNARNGLEKCPTACACTSEFCRRLALDAGVSFFAPPSAVK